MTDDMKEQNKDKTEGQLLSEQLSFSFKNLWKPEDKAETDRIMAFSEGYKEALDKGKTEREFVAFGVERLKVNGFKDMASFEKLRAGDRVYEVVRNRGLVAAVIGEADPLQGFNLVGSHVDSPRLDLKPNPLYEASDMSLLKTHYYGGIKKYHWVAMPLALHGVAQLKDGKTVRIVIGEDADDPVLSITDLLPHLGREQMKKTASQVIEGEELNVVFSGIPFPDDEVKERYKLAALKWLYDRYGITERELLTAELQLVPAQKARDVGIDRAFVGAYGQDDHVCAYTSLEALIDLDTPIGRTAIVLFYDKEEIGSDGNTGAKSFLYPYVQHKFVRMMLGREPSALELSDNIVNSTMLSSDVTNAYDPTFASVSDGNNSSYAGRGMAFNKYTGSGGKYSTTDASSEYFDEVVRLLESHNIPWQTGEMGKVDCGGGGTVAKYQAEQGLEVIDCGVPLFSMHSCFELASKVDIYNAYRAYGIFLKHMRNER